LRGFLGIEAGERGEKSLFGAGNRGARTVLTGVFGGFGVSFRRRRGGFCTPSVGGGCDKKVGKEAQTGFATDSEAITD